MNDKSLLRAGASSPVGPVLVGPIFDANMGAVVASTIIAR